LPSARQRYLALAPKSNAVKEAYQAARAAIEQGASLEVPLHLRNASFGGARALGYGVGYTYSHDFDPDDPRRYRQRYLPDGVPEGAFYKPRAVGYEAEHARRLEHLRELRQRARQHDR
jgi:putative ATPase